MIVMFSQNAILIVGLLESDVETLHAGKTVEYIDPPHDPQLVQSIIVFHGRDREHLLEQLRAGGLQVTDAQAAVVLAGKRTDRPRRPH